MISSGWFLIIEVLFCYLLQLCFFHMTLECELVTGCCINTLSVNTVFNVGEYRRKAAPHSISNSDFFRPDNKDAQEIREYDFAYC